MKYWAIYTDKNKTFPPVAFFEYEDWAQEWIRSVFGEKSIGLLIDRCNIPIYQSAQQAVAGDAKGEVVNQENGA